MAARTLILLRHGKSDWSGGHSDRDRPLGPRGRRQAAEAGRWLAAEAGHLDLAVISSANRARSTWELANAELADPAPTELDERAYTFSFDDLLSVVRGFPDDARTVVLVGHNPALEDLIEELTGRWVRMPTSALAVVELDGPWLAASRGALGAAGRPPRSGTLRT